MTPPHNTQNVSTFLPEVVNVYDSIFKASIIVTQKYLQMQKVTYFPCILQLSFLCLYALIHLQLTFTLLSHVLLLHLTDVFMQLKN